MRTTEDDSTFIYGFFAISQRQTNRTLESILIHGHWNDCNERKKFNVFSFNATIIAANRQTAPAVQSSVDGLELITTS